MYKIYADDELIFDSTLEDYKIGKGQITLEADKSGSFTFSVYPEHPFYDKFVKLKTVIKVYKFEKIVFRGRILNDVTDYWNNKVITCEGELGFLNDSIIRPFEFTGKTEGLFKKYITEHNAQVIDDFKKFKIGNVTVIDPNDYIFRYSTLYQTTFDSMVERLTGSGLGGHFYITHGIDGRDEIPTINYVSDFPNVSNQTIEFGENLKNYTKTVKAEDIATAIIPLGATIENNNDDTNTDPGTGDDDNTSSGDDDNGIYIPGIGYIPIPIKKANEEPSEVAAYSNDTSSTTSEETSTKLTIASVNNGIDYVYSEKGVKTYGWIFKVVEWDDITIAQNLKQKAEEYLESIINQNIIIELNAIDLHFIDRSIESFNICDYVRVISAPHNIDITLLCTKQTIDLLKPENDSIVLGASFSSFADITNKTINSHIKKNETSYIRLINSQNAYIKNLEKRVDALETANIENAYIFAATGERLVSSDGFVLTAKKI